MSKIYEALERAHREVNLPATPSPMFTMNKRRPIPPRIQIEDRMAGVFEALLHNASMKIIQFVGSHSGEGTSTIVRQFAAVFAFKMHKSVLVLDADRINPVQHVFFDVNPGHCLNEATKDGGPIERAFCQVAYPRLSLCLVSRNSVSPAQVLNAGRLWEMLRIRFDLVVIDSPPLEVSSDALALARNADGVVLVLEAEKTRWPVVENLRNSIIEYGGNVLGIVLNKRRYYIPGWIYKWL
jgi:capsular exopolysaccharide synthesis family protein